MICQVVQKIAGPRFRSTCFALFPLALVQILRQQGKWVLFTSGLDVARFIFGPLEERETGGAARRTFSGYRLYTRCKSPLRGEQTVLASLAQSAHKSHPKIRRWKKHRQSGSLLRAPAAVPPAHFFCQDELTRVEADARDDERLKAAKAEDAPRMRKKRMEGLVVSDFPRGSPHLLKMFVPFLDICFPLLVLKGIHRYWKYRQLLFLPCTLPPNQQQ